MNIVGSRDIPAMYDRNARSMPIKDKTVFARNSNAVSIGMNLSRHSSIL